MHFEFTIPLEPVAKGRPRHTKGGHTYTPSKTRKAEQDLRYFLSKEWGNRPTLTGPLKLFARFTFQRPKSVSEQKRPYHCVRPDAENCLKLLQDAGSKLVWNDDCQFVIATVEKVYSETPSIYLHVTEVP
jgi:Holliday junction resolvase RusA-like endonuclease